MGYALSVKPTQFKTGLSDYLDVVSDTNIGIKFLRNINSTQTNKLYNTAEITGK